MTSSYDVTCVIVVLLELSKVYHKTNQYPQSQKDEDMCYLILLYVFFCHSKFLNKLSNLPCVQICICTNSIIVYCYIKSKGIYPPFCFNSQ